MIDHIDHLVLTTAREAECIRFYTQILGMQLETFVGGTPPVERRAFKFGRQKINLHVHVPGSQDWCFIASVPLTEVITRLQAAQWPILEGPVMRTGATQKIRSVYVRDPDLNLVEISEPA